MSKKLPIPAQNEIQALYEVAGSTLSTVAKHYNTSHPTVRKWLESYHIPLKDHKQASQEANNRNRYQIPNKEELEQLYKSHSLKHMEEHYSVGQSTLYQWLDYHSISRIGQQEACGKREYKFHKSSSFEDAIAEWCMDNRATNLLRHDRSLISPKELDMVLPDHKLAIEVCGVYWHSENFGKKSRSYHYAKWKACRDQDIELLTFFDSDPLHYIKSLLEYKLHLTSRRIYARNTLVGRLSPQEGNKFHRQHHAHGMANSGSVHLGLKHQELGLVMVMTLSRSRFSKNHEWEILRMTNAHGTAVIGGASKLWSNFVSTYRPSNVVTYADLRFGSGGTYPKLGFTFSHISSPNYFYFHKSDSTKLLSRNVFQKHKLAKTLPIFDPEKTEWENMQENGYDRIWDCGNAVYIWTSHKYP